jgi:SAM-dependent methyltransferase
MNTALKEIYYENRPNWIDGTSQFRNMIQRNLSSASSVLDVGAGSGRTYNFNFSGKVARLVGIDISEEVLGNKFLDEAYCCDATQMPFPDGSFDMVYSDYVFEHLPNPQAVVSEIFRVMKPGAALCVRTPNKWHYVTMIARLLPDRSHPRLLNSLAIRSKEDVFPKHYRINTADELLDTCHRAGLHLDELQLVEKEPFYLMRWPVLFRIGVAYERLVNSTERLRFLRANILACFRRPSCSDQELK